MKNGESVFPVFEEARVNSDGSPCTDYALTDPGMTLKQYAAIQLKVPRSGDADIDAMIRENLRAEFAGLALTKLVFPIGSIASYESTEKQLRVKQCFSFADAMIAELEKEAGTINDKEKK
jgi:hypothetical protein